MKSNCDVRCVCAASDEVGVKLQVCNSINEEFFLSYLRFAVFIHGKSAQLIHSTDHHYLNSVIFHTWMYVFIPYNIVSMSVAFFYMFNDKFFFWMRMYAVLLHFSFILLSHECFCYCYVRFVIVGS